MTSAFQLKVNPDGIAEVIFDLPGEKVNKFSTAVMEQLEVVIDKVLQNPSGIKALKIISGKPDVFIAGADLHTFEPAFEDPSIVDRLIKTGHRVFAKIAALPFPTVAVINGACLGGGLELALSCTYRVVSDNPKTQLGLPEVSLGIYPGWGGTQRLPRLVGLVEGLNLILTGRAVPARKAFKIHLADAIYSPEFLADEANEFTKEILTKKGQERVLEQRKKRSWVNKLLESNPVGRSLVFYKSKNEVLDKTKGRYPAPLIALDIVKQTYTLPLAEGLKIEADSFTKNIPEGFYLAKYLIALFFTQEAAKKETGVSSPIKPEDIKSAAVIGAGTMGAGIAWLLADHQIFTRLKDISWEIIGKGIGTVKALFDKGVKAKKITTYDLNLRFQKVSGTVDYSGFQHAQIIIEAATENLELKKKIYNEIEGAVKPNAIIASNTSSLTIAEMSVGMKHPERFVGMHFFNPVNKMPLVEVVAGKQTSQEAIAATFALCKKLGKLPLLVGDCAGFLVNRIFMQSANEVLLMLEEGYSMDSLEKATLDFGMPMDPFLLCDEVGVDVTYKVAKTLEHAYGERMKPAKLLQLMTEHELFGKKNGKGFYIYKNGKPEKVNPDVAKFIDKINNKQNQLPIENIIPRFLYGMINEASRCLEEKIILRADYLDLSLIMGTGFPPFRGGLLRYADKVGIANIVSTLKAFEKEFGVRFKPSAYLEDMAQKNKTFY